MSEQKIKTPGRLYKNIEELNLRSKEPLYDNMIEGYANVKEKFFTPFAYRLKKLSFLFSILVVFIGTLVLIGWAANISFLKKFSSHWVSMKVNTAICFLLAGFTLIILNGNKLERRQKIWSSVFSLIILCITTVTLLEYIFHFNAGIDELFFKDPLRVKGTASPGRPAIPTAFCFFLIGITLFLMTAKKISILVFQGLNLAAGLVALFALLGYLFGVKQLTDSSVHTAIAAPSSVSFLLLVLASLFLLPESGIMKLVSSNTSGGRLIRKSFPLIILTIIITGWLSMEAKWADFYDVYFGMTIYIMIIMIVFTITIFINAYSLTRSENKIKKEREFSNYLLDSIPGIMYLMDETGTLLKWNKNFETETGYTAREIAGMKALDFFTGDRSFIAGKLLEALDKGESKAEANLRSKTDQLTPYYFTAKKIFLEGKTLLLGTALNIDESRQMQQKLVANETMLKEAQRLAQLGNWELNLATGQLKWSDEIYRIFDLDPKVFGATYEAFLNAIHPDDRQYVAQSYETSVATHTSYSIDHRLQMKDGSTKFVHEQCVTFYDEDGHAIRSIGTVQDITERKLMEEQQKSVSIYTRSLIEASLDPLVTISPEGKITDVNQATIKVTGIERSKLIGTDFSDYFTEPCKAKSGYQRVLEEGFVTDYPLTIRNINGKLIEVLYNASVYEDVSGKILGVFAAARDVTAQKKAEEQLLKLNTTLEEKVKERTSQYETVNKELEAFTYSVSHDLRSPLRAVNSYSQILGEDYSECLDEDGRLILDNIIYNTIKMGKLIDELLAFSRLGRKQLERTEIDMNVLVNEVLDEFNKSVEHHAEIKPGQLPIVKADQTLMHQVMLNLISNAVKYSSKKEKPVVEIYAEEKNGKTMFVVKDNGVGFDMRFADKLFGVFQRLHSEKEFEGNGVGLAIVKRIINKHGGEVWGIGEENKGANFYFTLN